MVLMLAAERVRVKQTIAAACLPIVCVDSSIILTAEEAGPELRRFLELANDWGSPLVRVYGGPLAEEPGTRSSGKSTGTPRSRKLRSRCLSI